MAMVITQKVLGNGVTPTPFWEKFPKNTVFFLEKPPNYYVRKTKTKSKEEVQANNDYV